MADNKNMIYIMKLGQFILNILEYAENNLNFSMCCTDKVLSIVLNTHSSLLHMYIWHFL